jgi:hypothetical protein
MGTNRVDRLGRASSHPTRYGPCRALGILATMEHYVLSLDSRCRLCVARRTVAPFENASDIEACFLAVEHALAAVVRREYALLVDVRFGPSRNDPAFESTIVAHRGKLLFGFAKNAALANSAAGRLQIQRYAKTDGRVVFVSHEPGAVFEYLGVAVHEV